MTENGAQEWGSLILAVSLHVLLVTVGFWDVYVSWRGHSSSTVSCIVQAWAVSYPVLPLTAGIVLGHLFWPLRPAGTPLYPPGP